MAREYKEFHPRLVVEFLHNLYMHREYNGANIAPLINDRNADLKYPEGIREHGVGYGEMQEFNELFHDLHGIGSPGSSLDPSQKEAFAAKLDVISNRVDTFIQSHSKDIIDLGAVEDRIRNLSAQIEREEGKRDLIRERLGLS